MVNLGHDIDRALPELQAQAESRMTDTVRITRGGAPVWDEETGTYSDGGTIIYEGNCRLKLTSTVVSDVDSQGQLLAEQRPQLHLPVLTPGTVGTSGAVRPNDTAVILTSRNDPSAVGTVLTIGGRAIGTDATARRFPVEVQS
jgi:hypothetical protein